MRDLRKDDPEHEGRYCEPLYFRKRLMQRTVSEQPGGVHYFYRRGEKGDHSHVQVISPNEKYSAVGARGVKKSAGNPSHKVLRVGPKDTNPLAPCGRRRRRSGHDVVISHASARCAFQNLRPRYHAIDGHRVGLTVIDRFLRGESASYTNECMHVSV